jgi:protein SERAC1
VSEFCSLVTLGVLVILNSWMQKLAQYRSLKTNPYSSIVFIHGLQGHPYRTWAQPPLTKTDEKPTSSPSLRHIWPKMTTSITTSILRSGDEEPPMTTFAPAPISGQNSKLLSLSTDHVNPAMVYWPGDLLPLECPHTRMCLR